MINAPMVDEQPASEGQDASADPAARDASGSRTRVPVIIACSEDDLDAVDGAAGSLRDRGYEVMVVGGAERSPEQLAEVVEGFDRQGLYVLCRGGALDRAAIDSLRTVLRDHEVPFGRTLTLATGRGGARALEERIVSVARRMVTGRFERGGGLPPPPRTSPVAKPAVSGAPTPTPTPRPEVVRSEPLEESDVDRWADSLAGGRRVDPDAVLELPELEEDLPTAVGERGSDSAEIDSGPIAVGEEAFEVTDPGNVADPGESAYEPVDTTLVTRSPLSPAVEPSFQPSLPATDVGPQGAAEPDSAPASVPSTESATSDDEVEMSSFESGGSLRLYIGAAAAVMITIALIAFFASGSDDAEEVADASGSVADVDGTRTAEEVEAAEVEAAPPAAVPSAEPEPEEDDPVVEVAAEPDTPAEAPPRAAAEAGSSLAHRSRVDPALLDDGPLDGAAPEDHQAVARALAEREVRAWNVFLLAGDDAAAMVFSDAETFCKTLSVGEVSGWRLPSIGELSSLSGAKMLGKSVYWSETPGDAFGETRMVLNARKRSMSAVTTGWDGAKPICVRVRD